MRRPSLAHKQQKTLCLEWGLKLLVYEAFRPHTRVWRLKHELRGTQGRQDRVSRKQTSFRSTVVCSPILFEPNAPRITSFSWGLNVTWLHIFVPPGSIFSVVCVCVCVCVCVYVKKTPKWVGVFRLAEMLSDRCKSHEFDRARNVYTTLNTTK
jgi:hypothetical protein